MPNWCENRVTISGDVDEIANFRKTVEGPDQYGAESIFSFHRLLPMPEELVNTTSPPTVKATQAECDEYNNGDNHCIAVTQETVDTRKEKYGASNWYAWANNEWGTKWQATGVELDTDEADNGPASCLVYHFDTAWGPPEGIWGAILQQFPKLSVSWFYDEPGMEICGYMGAD